MFSIVYRVPQMKLAFPAMKASPCILLKYSKSNAAAFMPEMILKATWSSPGTRSPKLRRDGSLLQASPLVLKIYRTAYGVQFRSWTMLTLV